jgi:hypothetical protein
VMVFTAQGATLSAMEICTGMAQMVDCTRTSLPLLLSNLPFQTGIRLATLSTNGCIAALGNLPSKRGTPGMCMGKKRPHNPAALRLDPYASCHNGWGTPGS